MAKSFTRGTVTVRQLWGALALAVAVAKPYLLRPSASSTSSAGATFRFSFLQSAGASPEARWLACIN